MYRAFSNLLMCLLSSAMVALDAPADSLRQKWMDWSSIEYPPTDTMGVQLAVDLSSAYQDFGEMDSALIMSSIGIALAERGLRATKEHQQAPWLNRRMIAERMKAGQLFFLNRYPESIVAIQAYLATAEELKLPEEIGAAYNYMGYCYTAMEDLPSALASSRKAMMIMRDLGGGIDLANAYTGLGNILDEMGEHDSALVYMRKALDLHRALDRPNNHAATLFSAIETLRMLGWGDSIDVYLERVKLLVDELGQPRPTMNYLNLLGQRELETGRQAEAIPHLLVADTLATELEDHRARHYINRALALAYAGVGHAKEAVARAALADMELKEDMSLEKVRALAAAQVRAEQEMELATAATNAEAYRKGRWFAWTMAVGGIAVALLLGVLYRQGRRNAQRLAAAQDDLMRLEKQREAERVRMSISRDIHDELGGSLSKIALLSDLVQQGATGATENVHLRSIADHARQVRGSLNDVVWAADPSSDHAGALLQHVADRAHRLLDGTGIELRLDLQVDDQTRSLGPAFKRDLSMVVKEALNNALKHAAPTIVCVRFHIRSDRFDLSVTDNGHGFSHDSWADGNGLVNMRERIAMHGANMTIHPAADGTGTVVQATGWLASA